MDKAAPAEALKLRYAHNPRHKEPWQPGRRGSLCPKDVGLADAERMLRESFVHGQQRYAVNKGRAFAGKLHGTETWHGHPVGWVEVLECVRQHFRKAGLVSNRDINRYWKTTRP